MTALADNPVRLSKKARRRLAAVPRIPDHRELNPSSHPLPPGRGQGAGSSPSRATDLSSGQCSPSSPPPEPSPSESPSPLCALCASAVNPVFASLLPDFLSAELSLPALAERHNLSLLELIDLLDSPQFIALIDRLNAIAERRAATVALHARPGALAGLESVITTTTSPETARKAAATLIRASDRVLTPRRAQSRTSVEQPEPQPTTPTLDLGPTPQVPVSPSGAGFQPASDESNLAPAPSP